VNDRIEEYQGMFFEKDDGCRQTVQTKTHSLVNIAEVTTLDVWSA
jgi:hypothetical protein